MLQTAHKLRAVIFSCPEGTAPKQPATTTSAAAATLCYPPRFITIRPRSRLRLVISFEYPFRSVSNHPKSCVTTFEAEIDEHVSNYSLESEVIPTSAE